MDLNTLRRLHDIIFATKVTKDPKRPTRCISISNVDNIRALSKELLPKNQSDRLLYLLRTLQVETFEKMKKKDEALLVENKLLNKDQHIGEGFFAKMAEMGREVSYYIKHGCRADEAINNFISHEWPIGHRIYR